MARRDRRRATWGALVASLVVHLVILIVLAQEVAPSFRTPPAETDFRVDLVPPPEAPPPPPQPHPRRPPRVVPVAPRPLPPARAEPARAIASRLRPPPPRAPPAPFAPPSRTIANLPAADPRAGSTGPGQGRWTVEGEDEADAGVRRVLRATVGCAHEDFAQLRPDERAECERRMGREARMLSPSQADQIPTAKRVGYDATRDAYQSLHDNRPRFDSQGNEVAAGHGPALGCKLGGKTGPPNSLKLGPCFVSPPQGLFTEESGVPKP